MSKASRQIAYIEFEELRHHLRKSKAASHLGFELTAAESGRATVRMRVRSRHRQIHGVVHGGILAALADTAGGMATYMSCPRGTRVATIELKINYLEAVERGSVVAQAKVVRVGKHISVVDCDLRQDSRIVGKALMTFFVALKSKI